MDVIFEISIKGWSRNIFSFMKKFGCRHMNYSDRAALLHEKMTPPLNIETMDIC